MLSLYHLELLVIQCQEEAQKGLANGVYASIPKIKIDVVPPQTFLGAENNPAIFINERTYKLIGSSHKNWEKNRTIVLKKNFLKAEPMQIIGTIIHETGHAFNVAAGIPNTEANAYIYEIEVINKLLETQSPLLFGCSFDDVRSFFKDRLAQYRKETRRNEYLAQLVESIQKQFKLEDETLSSQPINTEESSFFVTMGLTFFSRKQWQKENAIVWSKLTVGI